MKKSDLNHLVFTLKRIVLVLCLYFLYRVTFYLLNLAYFGHLPLSEVVGIFFWGIRFDLSSIFVLNSLFILLNTFPLEFKKSRIFQSISEIAFYLPNVVGLAVNFADTVYYRFTLKRMTFDIFRYLETDETSVNQIPRYLVDFWPVTLVFLLFVFSLFWFGNRIKMKNSNHERFNLRFFSIKTLTFLLSMFFTVIMIRGGFQLKPISLITAGEYTSAENSSFLLNTPFTIIKTFSQKGLELQNYLSENEMNRYFNPIQDYTEENMSDTCHFRKMNVVLIILESFSKEHIGFFKSGNEKEKQVGFTPFLDSLCAQSLVFTNGFANGKRSIEGIPAIVASIPTFMEQAYITSNYAGNRINSLASLLNKKGYETSFYHGGANGTMGFESFTKMAGFNKYSGKNEYPFKADFDGDWGIWDEPYLRFWADELNRMKTPFLSVIFTLSSHHPYKVPEKYDKILPRGKLEIQQSIAYTDLALNHFFEKINTMPWYENTLFIITADHTSEAYLPEYQNRVGNFRIPIVFFNPKQEVMGIDSTILSQSDILPSILDYINYDDTFIAFGQSAFSENRIPFSVNYLNGNYQILKGRYSLQWMDGKSVAIYDYLNDPLLKVNLIDSGISEQPELENSLKAMIQQYSFRLINNKLVIE